MKEWHSITELFTFLNKRVEYVVLRNYEELFNDNFDVNHPDIDILCADASFFNMSIESISRAKNVSDLVHRLVIVDNKEVFIDIREVGDGYYDATWEREILNTRRMINNSFYGPNEENYFYSLLYHCLVQKKDISEDYIKKLTSLARLINVNFDVNQGFECLENYMRRKGYKYYYPKSPWTHFHIEKADKSLVKFDTVRYVKRKMANIYKLIK